MSIPTHSEQSSDSRDVRTPPPAVTDADENLFTVLRNQARSRSRAGAAIWAILGFMATALGNWHF